MNWEAAITWFVAFVISTTFHEAAHAWVAMLGGDRTAQRAGQVTLNPLPHMQREPFGMVVLPLLSLWISNATMCFGYASAPYDPIWAYRNPRKSALMSAAGPLANVLLAAIAFAVLYGLGRPVGANEEAVATIAFTFLALNILLAVFNLLPLRPLDGAGVVVGLFPQTRGFYDLIDRIPYASILTFILLIQVLPHVYRPVLFAVVGLLP
jgi:Zn-dependent protease